jgi:hypothetical protein
MEDLVTDPLASYAFLGQDQQQAILHVDGLDNLLMEFPGTLDVMRREPTPDALVVIQPNRAQVRVSWAWSQ